MQPPVSPLCAENLQKCGLWEKAGASYPLINDVMEQVKKDSWEARVEVKGLNNQEVPGE
jgi:hypothetical protein